MPVPETIVLPDQNKEKETKKKSAGILSKSIELCDLSFLQEFLHSEERMDEIEKLTLQEKEALVLLLVEFLDQPVRLEAMDVIYQIIAKIGRVEGITKKLVARAVDFNKLVYLKGKIDYLKYINNKEESSIPQQEYNEED